MNRPLLLILLVLLGAVTSLSDHQVLSTLACAIAGKAECSQEQTLSNPIEFENGHSVLSDDKVLSLLAEALANNEEFHAQETNAHAENEVVLQENNALNTLAQHLDTIENIMLGGSQESASTLGYSDEEVSLHDNAAEPTNADTKEKKPVGVVVGIVVASVGAPAVVLLAVIIILVVVVIIRKRNRPKDVHDALLD